MKAQKKPTLIDYFPIHSIEEDMEQIQVWVEAFGDVFSDHFEKIPTGDSSLFFVRTLEGISYHLSNNDVIIRGVQGEYYPCKKEIFNLTYDIVN